MCAHLEVLEHAVLRRVLSRRSDHQQEGPLAPLFMWDTYHCSLFHLSSTHGMISRVTFTGLADAWFQSAGLRNKAVELSR